MGKLGKALLGGLGAGLTSLGQGMAAENQQKREDERLETLDAFKERELLVREQESKLNQQRMEIANKQQQSLFNLKRYTQIMATSEMNPEQMAKANTDLINNGMVYKNNSIEASKFQEKKNATGQVEFAKPYAVWDVGTYNTDENDEPITGGDGKPEYIPHKTGNGKMIFWDRDEFVNYITKSANADEFSKYNFVTMNARKQRALDNTAYAEKLQVEAESVAGITKEAKDRQAIATDKARERNLDRVDNKALNNIKAMSRKELAASLRKDYPGEPITEVTAGKMAAIREVKKTRDIFAAAAVRALDPDDPATREDFINGAPGIPVAFMEKLYEEAEIIYEAEGKEGFATDGWFKKMYNKAALLFSGSKE
jgi:hypothetical protein